MNDSISIMFSNEQFSEIMKYMQFAEASTIQDAVMNAISLAFNDKASDMDTLVSARKKIEETSNKRMQSYPEGTVHRMYYCFGIRDACWTIDDMISNTADKENV